MQEIFRPSDVLRKNVQSSLLFIAPAELLIYNGGLSDQDCRNTDSDHSLQCYGNHLVTVQCVFDLAHSGDSVCIHTVYGRRAAAGICSGGAGRKQEMGYNRICQRDALHFPS